MKEWQSRKGTSSSEVLTGELMLAKSVIEDKNELIDRKDAKIRELQTRLQATEKDNEELQLALSRVMRRDEMLKAEERADVLNDVISEVVRVAASYEDLHGSSSSGLAAKIFALFEDKYDLRVIEAPAHSVDPALHHVVEVDHAGDQNGSIEILANGYRLGENVIRPALVKVILGLQRRRTETFGDSEAELWRKE